MAGCFLCAALCASVGGAQRHGCVVAKAAQRRYYGSMSRLGARLTLFACAMGIVGSLALGGCASYVKRGTALYADGRYVEAAEVFERTEYRLRNSSPHERANYGLYRGMTLLVLGDLHNSRRWLAYAYEVDRLHPGSLRPDKRALLARGWYNVEQHLRVVPRPVPPGTAIAASQPPPPIVLPAPDEGPAVERRGLQ